MKKLNLIGQKFGRLTVISPAEKKGKHYRWNCMCECGGATIAATTSLRQGNTKSCGCYQREMAADAHIKHGKSKTVEYSTWLRMKIRCYSKNGQSYSEYGGRGIRVCDRWMDSFEEFLADMGDRPDGKDSIDRIDNDKGYEPTNCRWATAKEQARNTRRTLYVMYKGRRRCLSELCENAGLAYHTVYNRINRNGWPVERALSNPIIGAL